MKIFLASDLHLEYRDLDILDVLRIDDLGYVPDLIILAGDINSGTKIFDSLASMNTLGIPVMYTPGNHEHWGILSVYDFYARLCALEQDCKNISIMDNSTWRTSGRPHRYAYGGTLWYPKNSATEKHPHFADLRRIPQSAVGSNFDSVLGYLSDQHEKFIDEYNYNVETYDYDIVVSHHMPDFRLVHPMYAHYSTNAFFASDTFSRINKPPKLWCYGHTHTFNDVVLDGTRFVCNPLGYPGEVTNYNPKLCIELELP